MNDTQDDEARIRAEAYELWVAEGQPTGRAEIHWLQAKEIIAIKDSFATTLIPVSRSTRENVEPAFVASEHGDVPGLTDQVDSQQAPSLDKAVAIADVNPLSSDRQSRAAEK